MFSWVVQNFPSGQVGASAAAGAFHLVVTPAVHPETKEFVGYAFKILGIQGGGTNFMSCSPTMAEAQQRAEFTFLTFILGALCVVDKDMLDQYIKHAKTMNELPLDEAVAAASALEQRNRDIMNAMHEKAQAEGPKIEE